MGEAEKISVAREAAVGIVRTLRGAGQVAYLAGGCVRDELWQLRPEDYDVATDAPPARVRQLFSNTQAVGAAFGVILVRERGQMIEVATFRADEAYSDGRRPDGVRFTTPQEDAQRRDFTINGLFLDPLTNEVIDYVGGQADLAARRLRAIGEPEARFAEDYLRVLRAVRFAARFELEIDPATAAAMARHGAKLVQISPERIADELRRMLTAETRTAAARLLAEFGLLPILLRYLGETEPVKDAEKSIAYLAAIKGEETISFSLALAGLLLSYRARGESALRLLAVNEVKRSVSAVRKALRISNEETEAVAAILSVGPMLGEELPRVATMKRFLATADARDARELLDAIGRVEGALRGRIAVLQKRLDELVALGDVAPVPLLSGDDLLAAGFTAGPAFKRILHEVYDAQLEGRVATAAAALELGREVAGRRPD